MRADQFDPAPPQALSQRVAVVSVVDNHPHRLLPQSPRAMTPSFTDRRERRFRRPDLRRRCRVKVFSQRNTRVVDRHHPPRPLAALGFPDSAAESPRREIRLEPTGGNYLLSVRNDRLIFAAAFAVVACLLVVGLFQMPLAQAAQPRYKVENRAQRAVTRWTNADLSKTFSFRSELPPRSTERPNDLHAIFGPHARKARLFQMPLLAPPY